MVMFSNTVKEAESLMSTLFEDERVNKNNKLQTYLTNSVLPIDTILLTEETILIITVKHL